GCPVHAGRREGGRPRRAPARAPGRRPGPAAGDVRRLGPPPGPPHLPPAVPRPARAPPGGGASVISAAYNLPPPDHFLFGTLFPCGALCPPARVAGGGALPRGPGGTPDGPAALRAPDPPGLLRRRAAADGPVGGAGPAPAAQRRPAGALGQQPRAGRPELAGR